MSIIGITIQLVDLNESDILNCQNTIKLLSNVSTLHDRLAQSTVTVDLGPCLQWNQHCTRETDSFATMAYVIK